MIPLWENGKFCISEPDTEPNWVGSFGSARYSRRYVATLQMFANLHGEDGLRKVPGPQVELPDPLLDGERPQDQPRSHSTRGRIIGVQGTLMAL